MQAQLLRSDIGRSMLETEDDVAAVEDFMVSSAAVCALPCLVVQCMHLVPLVYAFGAIFLTRQCQTWQVNEDLRRNNETMFGDAEDMEVCFRLCTMHAELGRSAKCCSMRTLHYAC